MPACCTCASVTTKAVICFAWADYQLFSSHVGEKREKKKGREKEWLTVVALYMLARFFV